MKRWTKIKRNKSLKGEGTRGESIVRKINIRRENRQNRWQENESEEASL